MDKEFLKETDSEAVYEYFKKKRKTFKIPKLKEGSYVIDPQKLGGAFEGRAVTFTEFLGGNAKKIYGKYSLLTGEFKNPYAKIILDFDGIFKEHFTGQKVYGLPYRWIDTVNPVDSNKDKVDIYCGETELSLKKNDIDSVFIHLEDLKVLKPKDLNRVYKIYSSEKKLAIFENEFLNFVYETEENLVESTENKQYLLLKRKEKNAYRNQVIY